MTLITTAPVVGTIVPVRMEQVQNKARGTLFFKGRGQSTSVLQAKVFNNQGNLHLDAIDARLENDSVNNVGAQMTLSNGSALRPAVGKLPRLENFGLLRKFGAGDAEVGLEWKNNGHLWLEGGTLRFRPPVGKVCEQLAGSLTLKGGALHVLNANASTGTFQMKGGILNGSGAINAHVVHSGGNLKPGFSPGIITINGNYTQTLNGTLDMELGGLAAGLGYDQLVVNGKAQLAGTLNLLSYNRFVPAPGATFQLIKYYAVSGNFQAVRWNTAGVSYRTTSTPSYYLATAAIIAPPVVQILSPRVNAIYSRIASVSGTAGSVGSNVTGVSVLLYRYATTSSSAGYWAGGTTWTSLYSGANERLATGTTSWKMLLPSLPAGRYWVRATARNAAGNVTRTTAVVFNVAVTGIVASVMARSNVVSHNPLSSTRVDGSSGTITLQFARPWVEESTSDVANYTVIINGLEIPLEAVMYRPAGNALQLFLPEGALTRGENVIVEWNNLRDSQGQGGAGQTTVLVP
jgi:hypothetical protein